MRVAYIMSVIDKIRTVIVSNGAQTLKFAKLSFMVKRDMKDNLNRVKDDKTGMLPARRYETSIRRIYIHSGGCHTVTVRLSGNLCLQGAVLEINGSIRQLAGVRRLDCPPLVSGRLQKLEPVRQSVSRATQQPPRS